MKKLIFLSLLFFFLSGCAQTPPAETTLPATVPTTAPATVPTEPPVLFPEAPENLSLQPLPEEPSAENLVEDYWVQQLQFPDGTVCYVTIPQILPFSPEAVACQEEIYQLFANELRPILESAPEGLTCVSTLPDADLTRAPASDRERYYTYSTGYRDGVLSVLLRIDSREEGSAPYRVYNLTVSEDPDTVVLPELKHMELYRTVENYYRTQFSPRESSSNKYQKALENTLGSELGLSQCFYTADGGISVLGNIYCPGSSGPEQRIIPFTPLNCEYQPRMKISGSYVWVPGSFFIDSGTLFEHDHSHAVTETVHPGPVSLAIRSRDHWFYTLEEDPGTLLRKDRNTKTEISLVTKENDTITDIGFFGYEDDGWLLVICGGTEILLYQVPEFTCVTYQHSGIDRIESYKSGSKTLVYWDAHRNLWELKLETGEVKQKN